MYKTKEFIGGSIPTDVQINEFLSHNNVQYVDVKYSYCENTFQTQGYSMALLIYIDIG